jgi:hypothetical protein
MTKQEAKVIEVVATAMRIALRSGDPSVGRIEAAAMNKAAMETATADIMKLLPKE